MVQRGRDMRFVPTTGEERHRNNIRLHRADFRISRHLNRRQAPSVVSEIGSSLPYRFFQRLRLQQRSTLIAQRHLDAQEGTPIEAIFTLRGD
jgi:hypothetical protein